jgi:Flp pilus assembly protein TadG
MGGVPRMLTSRFSGQTLTEFAMVLMVSFLFLFAIIEMAMALNAYSNICTAAREAARYAIVHSPTSANSPCPTSGQCTAVQNVAVNYAPFLSTSDVTEADFTCEATSTCTSSGVSKDYAVVTINHTYPLSIPFMASVNLSLSATSKMLVSQ